MAGAAVESNERAQTLADYFSQVQWAVRPMTAYETRPPIGEVLNINLGDIDYKEALQAACKLKRHQSSGINDISAELVKAILQEANSEACRFRFFCRIENVFAT